MLGRRRRAGLVAGAVVVGDAAAAAEARRGDGVALLAAGPATNLGLPAASRPAPEAARASQCCCPAASPAVEPNTLPRPLPPAAAAAADQTGVPAPLPPPAAVAPCRRMTAKANSKVLPNAAVSNCCGGEEDAATLAPLPPVDTRSTHGPSLGGKPAAARGDACPAAAAGAAGRGEGALAGGAASRSFWIACTGRQEPKKCLRDRVY